MLKLVSFTIGTLFPGVYKLIVAVLCVAFAAFVHLIVIPKLELHGYTLSFLEEPTSLDFSELIARWAPECIKKYVMWLEPTGMDTYETCQCFFWKSYWLFLYRIQVPWINRHCVYQFVWVNITTLSILNHLYNVMHGELNKRTLQQIEWITIACSFCWNYTFYTFEFYWNFTCMLVLLVVEYYGVVYLGERTKIAFFFIRILEICYQICTNCAAGEYWIGMYGVFGLILACAKLHIAWEKARILATWQPLALMGWVTLHLTQVTNGKLPFEACLMCVDQFCADKGTMEDTVQRNQSQRAARKPALTAWGYMSEELNRAQTVFGKVHTVDRAKKGFMNLIQRNGRIIEDQWPIIDPNNNETLQQYQEQRKRSLDNLNKLKAMVRHQ
jgi:hypothetical protein